MPLEDFDTIREDWTIVELEDQSIIRMRPVLLFLRKNQESGKPKETGHNVRLSLQMGVWAQTKGDPTQETITPELIQKNTTQRNLSFRFLGRGESLYRIEEGQLTLIMRPIQFDKTSLFDKDGEPVYLVNHEVSIVTSKEKD